MLAKSGKLFLLCETFWLPPASPFQLNQSYSTIHHLVVFLCFCWHEACHRFGGTTEVPLRQWWLQALQLKQQQYVAVFMCSCSHKACHRFRGMTNAQLYLWCLQASLTTLADLEEQHMINYNGGDCKLQLQQHPACVPFNMRPYSEKHQRINFIGGDCKQYS